MSEITTDRPFVLLANLVLADQQGQYEKAAAAQRRLAEIGWYVSKTPPEQPKPARRRKVAAQ